MIIIKEHNGILQVAQLGSAHSVAEPGNIVGGWIGIGPGLAPVITPGEGCYFITFTYLGHIYTRRMDAAIWPPQVVDPVTYTPNISIQEPHDSVCLQARSSTAGAKAITELVIGSARLFRGSGLIYDLSTGKISTTVIRDTNYNPTPATRKKWRVYSRLIGDVNWNLLQDWIDEVPTLQIEGTGSVKLELTASYGHLWTTEGRNSDPSLTGNYVESPKGPVLQIDSSIESWTLRYGFSDSVGVVQGGSPCGVVLGDRTSEWAYSAASSVEVNSHSTPVCSSMETSRSSGFQAPHLIETAVVLSMQHSPCSALLYS